MQNPVCTFATSYALLHVVAAWAREGADSRFVLCCVVSCRVGVSIPTKSSTVPAHVAVGTCSNAARRVARLMPM
jgi:hypothetical protein